MTKVYHIIVLLLISSLSCSDKPTQPQTNYLNWTVDTLRYSLQTIVNDIYGISSTNVYAAAYNYTAAIGTVWHFNGTSWSTQDMSQFGIHVFNSVMAFGDGRVFFVGKSVVANQTPPPSTTDTALVAILEGSNWTSVNLPAKELNSIWGSSSTDVWIGGDNGRLFHFDGSNWTQSTVYDNVSISSLTGFPPSQINALAYRLDQMPYDSIVTFIFQNDGSGWYVQDSLVQNTFPPNHAFGISDIWSLDNATLFSVGYGVFKKGGGQWVFDDGTLFAGIRGTRSDNIFAVGSGIYQDDGKWSKVNVAIDPSISIVSVWSDGKEVFAVGTDGTLSYVFHRK